MTAHDEEAGRPEEPLATASRTASRYRTLRGAVRHLLMRWSDPSARFAPPGHFYSPLPDRSFVEQRRATLFDRAAVMLDRAWNESYVLKAFLQFNAAFRICLFNSYLAMHHRPAMAGAIPLFLENPGGSLWIARVG